MNIPFLLLFSLISAFAVLSTAAATPKTYPSISKVIYMNSDSTYDCLLDSNQQLPVGATRLADIAIDFNQNVTGWDTVVVTADPDALSANFSNVYWASGYIEGFYTLDQILASNWSSQGPPLEGCAGKWMEDNIEWFSNFERNISPTENPQVFAGAARLFHLLRGLRDGINGAIAHFGLSGQVQAWTFRDVWEYNMQAELYDVELHCQLNSKEYQQRKKDDDDGLLPADMTRTAVMFNSPPGSHLRHRRGFGSHCSALVRMTSDDIFTAHDTWSGLASLGLRQYKTYKFETTVSMSGYPGMISSVDDFYQTSNGLSVIETTISIYNETLTKLYVVPQKTLPVFVRVMIANFAATSGPQWMDLFLTFNSGTYNDEFFVTDFNLVTPERIANKSLLPHTLTVVDQIPGPFSQIEDFTPLLNNQGYFPSYNIPGIKKARDITGNTAMAEKYGNLFSYEHYVRANIFRRNATMVENLQDMKDLMRWNRWETDPLQAINTQVHCSGCNPTQSPALAIANRQDLVPVNSKFGNISGAAVGQFEGAAFGAMDTKTTAWSMYDLQNKKYSATIINGPTTSNGHLPVFKWSTLPEAYNTVRHRMSPDAFDFPFITIDIDANPLPHPSNVATTTSLAGAVSSTASCVSADGSYAYLATGPYQKSGLFTVKIDSTTGLPSTSSTPSFLDLSSWSPERTYFSHCQITNDGKSLHLVYSRVLFGIDELSNHDNYGAFRLDLDISDAAKPKYNSRIQISAGLGSALPTAFFNKNTDMWYYGLGEQCQIYIVGAARTTDTSVVFLKKYTTEMCLDMALNVTNDVFFVVPACYSSSVVAGNLDSMTGYTCPVLRINAKQEVDAVGHIPFNFGSAEVKLINNGNTLIIRSGKFLVKMDAQTMEVLGVLSAVSTLNGPMVFDDDENFVFVGTVARPLAPATIIKINIMTNTPVFDSIVATQLLSGSPAALGTAFKISNKNNHGTYTIHFASGPVALTNTASVNVDPKSNNLYSFVGSEATPSPISPNTPSPGSNNNGNGGSGPSAGLIVGAVIGGLVGVIAVVVIGYVVWKRRSNASDGSGRVGPSVSALGSARAELVQSQDAGDTSNYHAV